MHGFEIVVSSQNPYMMTYFHSARVKNVFTTPSNSHHIEAEAYKFKTRFTETSTNRNSI